MTLAAKFCPYCAGPVKFVGGVPRCTNCRAVFFLNFSRYARKSPQKRAQCAKEKT